jgi:hypothetical protein
VSMAACIGVAGVRAPRHVQPPTSSLHHNRSDHTAPRPVSHFLGTVAGAAAHTSAGEGGRNTPPGCARATFCFGFHVCIPFHTLLPPTLLPATTTTTPENRRRTRSENATLRLCEPARRAVLGADRFRGRGVRDNVYTMSYSSSFSLLAREGVGGAAHHGGGSRHGRALLRALAASCCLSPRCQFAFQRLQRTPAGWPRLRLGRLQLRRESQAEVENTPPSASGSQDTSWCW